jgi:hypothetical protein
VPEFDQGAVRWRRCRAPSIGRRAARGGCAGRLGITDIVADDTLTDAERARRADAVECLGRALTANGYRRLLRDAGFIEDGSSGGRMRTASPRSAEQQDPHPSPIYPVVN